MNRKFQFFLRCFLNGFLNRTRNGNQRVLTGKKIYNEKENTIKLAGYLCRLKQSIGQGLVEFALILPVLLLLVIGTLDFGLAFYIKVVLENSAREGAYYMVYHPTDGAANSFALAKTAVQIEGQNSGISITSQDINVTCVQGTTVNNTCPSGSTVIVTVQHQMALPVDVLFHGPLLLASDARMLIP